MSKPLATLCFLILTIPVTTNAFEYPFTESAETAAIKDPNSPASIQINAVDRFWRSSGVILEAGKTYLVIAEGKPNN